MRLLALRTETMEGVRRLKLPCDDITPIGLWGSDMYLIGVNNEQFEVLRTWNVETEDITPETLRELDTDSPAVPTVPSAGNTASGARSSAREEPRRGSSSTSQAPARMQSSTPMRSAPVAQLPQSAPARQARPAPEPAPAVPVSFTETVVDSTPVSIAPLVLDTPDLMTAPKMPAPETPSTSASRGNGMEGLERGGMANGATVAAFSPPSVPERQGPSLTLEPKSNSSSRGSRTEERKLEVSKPAPTASDARSAEKDGGGSTSAGKLRMTVDGEHLYAEIKGGKIQLKDRTYDSLAHARDSIRRERNKVAVWEYFDEGVKAWRVLNRD